MTIFLDGLDRQVCKRLAVVLARAMPGDRPHYVLPGTRILKFLAYQVLGGKPERVAAFLARNPFDVAWGSFWRDVPGLKRGGDSPHVHVWVGSSPPGADTFDVVASPEGVLRFFAERWLGSELKESELKGLALEPEVLNAPWVVAAADRLCSPEFVIPLFVRHPSCYALPHGRDESPLVFTTEAPEGTAADVAVDNHIPRLEGTPPGRPAIALRQEFPDMVNRRVRAYPPNTTLVLSNTAFDHPTLRVEHFGGNGTWARVKSVLALTDMPKTRNVSLVASKKRFLPGHRLRHQVVAALAKKHGVAVMGRGYRPVATKDEAHLPFRYSVVIENERSPYFFTEKLTDCLRCGCVALYWGAPNVAEFYSMGSIRPWSTLAELDALLAQCSVKDFRSRKRAIQANIYLAAARPTMACCVALDTSLMWTLRRHGQEWGQEDGKNGKVEGVGGVLGDGA